MEPPDVMVLDCSFPPGARPPRNHNDVPRALEIVAAVRPGRSVLTHIDHRLDAWLMDHPDALPEGVELASDGLQISL